MRPGRGVPAELVPALRELVQAEVRAELARVLGRLVDVTTGGPGAIVYSTRRDDGPPGWGHRAWQRIAATIPGAVRRGRWVFVSADALRKWETSAVTPGHVTATNSAANDDETTRWSPRAALASVGLRATRSGR